MKYCGVAENSLGVICYNARWYDFSLGRFAQADSIVPPGVQGLDRYSYANNNPIRFIDPSGHLSCNHANAAEGDCEDRTTIEILRDEYDITLNTEEQQFTEREISAIYKAARSVGAAFAREMIGITSTVSEAFKKIYDPLTFKKVDEFYYQGAKYDAGCKTEGNTITCAPFAPQSGYFQSATNNIVHELGHVFEPNSGSGIPSIFVDKRYDILHNNNTIMWQANDAATPGETFGDFFVAWVYGIWGPDANAIFPGQERSPREWMSTNMTDWLHP